MRVRALLFVAVMFASATASAADMEEIYVLRSIREPQAAMAGWCDRARTVFEAMPTDAEHSFSFWSVEARDGKLVGAKVARVAELRACFGPTNDRTRQNLHAEIRLGTLPLHGDGECLALLVDFPEPGLFPGRCQLVLGGLPAPFVGGVLTTNTIATQAAFGGDRTPLEHPQASIATIRLWRAR